MIFNYFRSAASRYFTSVLAVAVAVLVTHLIWPQPAIPNDTFLVAAVLVSAFVGGFGPALLATALAGCAVVFVVVPPRYEFVLDGDDALSLFVSLLGGFLHVASRRATEMAQEARKVAESADAAKGRFVAMVTHELRTPLSPVVMMAQMLERDLRLPVDAREDMAVVRRNAETVARLVDDLLDVVRTGTGKLSLTPQAELTQRSNNSIHGAVVDARVARVRFDRGDIAQLNLHVESLRLVCHSGTRASRNVGGIGADWGDGRPGGERPDVSRHVRN